MSNRTSSKSHWCNPEIRPKVKVATKRRKAITRAKAQVRTTKKIEAYSKAVANLKSDF